MKFAYFYLKAKSTELIQDLNDLNISNKYINL